MVEILPRLELPPVNSEAGIIARMLIAENIMPDDKAKKFTNLDDSLTAMQWMRIALENRLSFSHPQLLQVPKGATRLPELIKSRGVIEGFDNYPDIPLSQMKNIKNAVRIANDASISTFQLYRGYIKNAIDVAEGSRKGTDPCPTKLYM